MAAPARTSASGLDLHLELPPATGRRAALEQALRAAVQEGRLAPHTRLPPTRALARELALSRGTVSAAYDQLVAEGYLTARRGSGTEVAALPGGLPRPGTDPGGPAAEDADPAAAGPADPAGSRPPPVPVRFDLRPGRPDVSTFPVTAWTHATRRALAAATMSVYDYGDPQGRPELRAALATYLGRVRGVVTSPERIVVTSGAVQALALLAQVLGAGGGAFGMEEPGLTFHRTVVRRQGVRVEPLPVDEDGARTDLLAAGAFPGLRAAVLTPAHQYPSGAVLPPGRRHLAADWARRTGAVVIEDDYDGEFRYDRQSVGALQGMAPEDVVYLGSASKSIGPALRLAWLAVPARLVGPLVEAKRCADLHTETIGQLTLADLIAGHAYDRHVRTCRQRYRRRRALLLERLGTDGGCRVRGIAAGLHCVVDLPEPGPGEREVRAAATGRGLALGYLGSHWQDPRDRPQALIVGFGAPSEATFPVALETLAQTLSGLRRRR